MLTINCGSIHDWERYSQPISYPIDHTEPQSLGLRLHSSEPVAVYVSDELTGETPVLVATGSGRIEVRFSVIGSALVSIIPTGDAPVFVQHFHRSQTVVDNNESLTTVRPFARRDPNLDRMMMLNKIQEERHRSEMARIFEELKARRQPEPEVIEPSPQPQPEPTPQEPST